MFMKNRSKLFVIALLLLFSSKGFSQPYYFFPKFFSDRVDPDTNVTAPVSGADIYRVDLNTGNVKLFLYNIPHYNGIIIDPTEQWAYINYYRGAGLRIVNINDTSRYFDAVSNQEFQGEIDGYAGVIYLPEKNRFYVTWLTPDTISGSGDISETTIYDATTFKKIGDIDFGFSFADMVSPDNEYVYQYSADSLGNEELVKFSTTTNSVIDKNVFGQVGPLTEHKAIEDAANGFFLLAYDTSSVPSIDYRYVIYDPVTDLLYASVYFPWRSKGYLSSDGKYIILEEVNWDTTRTSLEYRPGIVYVFNALNGELMQRLSLPPDGKILVFDNYPQIFYYYNDSTHQSVSVNVTTVMPVKTLLDTLISLKHQAVANGWIDNRGIANSLDSKLDNAKSKLAAGNTKAVRNILNAFIKEVEAQNGKHLTSDAYTLLKYNAEYLIGRLP